MIEWIGLAIVIVVIFIMEGRPPRPWGYRPKGPSRPPGPPPKNPGSVSPRPKEEP